MTDKLLEAIDGYDPHSLKITCGECDETLYNGLGATPPMDNPGFFAEVVRFATVRHHRETDHTGVTVAVVLEPHIETIDIELDVGP